MMFEGKKSKEKKGKKNFLKKKSVGDSHSDRKHNNRFV